MQQQQDFNLSNDFTLRNNFSVVTKYTIEDHNKIAFQLINSSKLVGHFYHYYVDFFKNLFINKFQVRLN
jgi:hypothetical protein